MDGEVIVLGQDGRSDFQALQHVLAKDVERSLHYYVFDILYLNGYDVQSLPLIERKNLLRTLLDQNNMSEYSVLYSQHIEGKGKCFFKKHLHELPLWRVYILFCFQK